MAQETLQLNRWHTVGCTTVVVTAESHEGALHDPTNAPFNRKVLGSGRNDQAVQIRVCLDKHAQGVYNTC
jgi:hypothetical protein